MKEYPSAIIRRLFSEVGSNSLKNEEYIRQLQQHCQRSPLPGTCYLTLRLGKRPYVSWSHRTEEQLGYPDIDYGQLLDLVHPAWRTLYYAVCGTTYQLMKDHPERMRAEEIAAVVQVPLLTADTHYYWYNQITVPCGFSTGGQLVAHLNYYHRLARYADLRPGPPEVVHASGKDELITPILEQYFPAIEQLFLSDIFTKRQAAFLRSYRELLWEADGGKLGREEIIAGTRVPSPDALDKVQQRIAIRIRDHFGAWCVSGTREFALFLNHLFG